MTRDEILAMKPGRELDARVAEKVMGWKTNWLKTDWWEEINPNTHHHKGLVKDFKPSTDISAAWEVVEKMFERGGCEIGCYGSKSGGKWFEVIVITMNGEVKVTAHTAHEAICKAALLAVMEE